MSVGVNANLLIFTKQFAAMIKNNLPMVPALKSLARETPNRKLRLVLQDILDKVRAGQDFDRALADYPKIFNPTYIGVVRAGMQSGQLGDALTQIYEYMANLDSVIKKARSAMVYPLLLVVSFAIVFHMMVFGILPRFETLFAQFGKPLPGPTQFVLLIGEIYKAIWPSVLTIIAAMSVSLYVWLGLPSGRATFDRIKLSIPLIGPLMRLSALARFARTLGIQVQNSVSLLDAIRVAAPASNNKHVEASLNEIANEIERGQGIAQAFQKQELFRGVVQQMIATGEQTGQLSEPLLSAANYFEALWTQRLDAVITLINPALTAIMGLLISGMLVAAFLPIFEASGVTMP